MWNEARRTGNKQLAQQLKGARFALWKRPEKLTDRQQAKLAFIQKLNAPIYRAYLLKEQLRAIYHGATTDDALKLLDGWLKWLGGAALSRSHTRWLRHAAHLPAQSETA